MSEHDHDQTLLASAYLDDEATPDERAIVDASPEALAEAELLGQVRTVLAATIEPVSLAEREAHLAAALSVFERMSDMERSGESTPSAGVDAAAAAAVTTPMSSSDTGRHRRPARRVAGTPTWLLSAAAALLVLVGAGVVLNGIVNDGADDNTAGPSADSSPAAASEVESVEQQEALEVEGENTNDDPLFAESGEIGDSAAEPGFDEGGLFPSDDEAGGDTADAPTSADAEVAGEDAPSEDTGTSDFDLQRLTTTQDLANFAVLAVQPIGPGGTVPATDIDREPPVGSCERQLGIERIAGAALYNGQLVRVGIDIDNDGVFAYLDDCTVVETTVLGAASDVARGDG